MYTDINALQERITHLQNHTEATKTALTKAWQDKNIKLIQHLEQNLKRNNNRLEYFEKMLENATPKIEKE